MTISYDNPPLVELLAELRWNSPHIALQATPQLNSPVPLPILAGAGKMEQFFMRFGAEIYQTGFKRAERVLPGNFPILPFQPVYRYRGEDQSLPQLYQVGAGLFSAHAVPPYKTWRQFQPFVKTGIETLLRSRNEEESNIPFNSVKLRYIDAFKAEHLGGKNIQNFISETLGFKIILPKAVSELIPSGLSVSSVLNLTVPMPDDLVATFVVGEGLNNGLPALILDTTISTKNPVVPDIEKIIQMLNQAHSLINNIFIKITDPIRDIMGPRNTETD